VRREPKFKTEADLCAAFIAWVARKYPDIKCFAEWAGWDILIAYPDGFQIGVQAKLKLNADVIGQASPSDWGYDDHGPDYRALLVPERSALHFIALRLGLIVFEARSDWDYKAQEKTYQFFPDLMGWRGLPVDPEWLDWNPRNRHVLPPTCTDSIAGSSAPVSLTPWKLCALDVLAELAVKGRITAKRMRELGVTPGRWTTYRWLEPSEPRGNWVRGDRCPKFDEQHPTAFAAALEKAKRVPTLLEAITL